MKKTTKIFNLFQNLTYCAKFSRVTHHFAYDRAPPLDLSLSLFQRMNRIHISPMCHHISLKKIQVPPSPKAVALPIHPKEQCPTSIPKQQCPLPSQKSSAPFHPKRQGKQSRTGFSCRWSYGSKVIEQPCEQARRLLHHLSPTPVGGKSPSMTKIALA